MKKTFLITALFISASMYAASDNRIDLSGTWQFGYGDRPVYKDKIKLPGSMLTNGKGKDVDTNTKWTGSLYDMSYYYSDLYKPTVNRIISSFPSFLRLTKNM